GRSPTPGPTPGWRAWTTDDRSGPSCRWHRSRRRAPTRPGSCTCATSCARTPATGTPDVGASFPTAARGVATGVGRSMADQETPDTPADAKPITLLELKHLRWAVVAAASLAVGALSYGDGRWAAKDQVETVEQRVVSVEQDWLRPNSTRWASR